MNSSLRASPCVPTEQTDRFEVGDTVLCIKGGTRAGWSSKLVEGETYVVVEVFDNGWMQGVNLDDPRLPPGVPPYSASRFVRAGERQASVSDDTQPGTQASLEAGVNPLPHPSSPQGEQT